ncbi:MAG: hypothetical protein K2M36_03230, partial [Clostridia bacterium]|nr:hypothetical protein [Clostridia bacterium]
MYHPDYFYADVFSTSISAGTGANGQYVGYLDTSRALNTYVGDLDSAAKIDAAVTAYNNAVNAIVTEANKVSTVVGKIEYVNNYIKTNNTYGYGTKVVDGKNVDTEKAAFIHTSYGALVYNESVCEGYAKAFKAVMDRLEIPCVLVAGYVYNDGFQPHMWNYVQVEEMWYGVDVTNNDWSENKYLLCGGDAMLGDYIVDNVVSTSEYELPCPAIKPYSYGNDTDSNGMVIVGKYTDNEEGGKDLAISVSYNGKGALKLEEEGLYLAYRYTIDNTVDGVETWADWTNIVVSRNFMIEYYEWEADDFYIITDEDTTVPIASGVKYVEFAILNRTADDSTGLYKDVKESDFVVKPSTQYINDGYVHVDRAPFPVKVTPSNTRTWSLNKVHIVIEYDRRLALADSAKPAGITYTNYENYKDIDKYVKLENFKWDGERTISFDFTPSMQYEHYKAS